MHPNLIYTYVWLVRQIRARAGAILTALTLVTLVGGVVAFQVEAAARGDTMRFAEALYSTLGLFAFAGNRFGFPQTRPLVAVYFIAPYITASALLEAALRVLAERNSILLAGMRGHTVICGAGRLGMFLAHEHDRNRTPTVVIDSETPDHMQGTNALVVVGDIKKESTLRDARADNAGRVYVTTGDDLINLEVATRLDRRLSALPSTNSPTIYCHISDHRLRDTLLNPAGPHRVYYFNSYRLAAKALIARMFAFGWLPSLQIEPGAFLEIQDGSFALSTSRSTTAPLKVYVVGLGRFGSALAEQLADLLPSDTELIIVDNQQQSVHAAASRISSKSNIQHLCADVTSASWRVHLADPNNRSLVFLCTDQDRDNLRVAMELTRTARTVVRMFDQPLGGRFSPQGGERFELEIAAFQHLFHDALPMLTHQGDVEGPSGKMHRIRTCLRLREGGERWYLVWLSEIEQSKARAAGPDHALQIAQLAEAEGGVSSFWWLVRSGMLETAFKR